VFSIFKQEKREIYISEPDLEAAHAHLMALPQSKTGVMPRQWGREWVLQCLREALGGLNDNATGEASCVSFGPGLWALIVPFGIDLAGPGSVDGKYQVWVLVRSAGTDPQRITKL
jgi:hypothetical protein